jgi:signal peptidase I
VADIRSEIREYAEAFGIAIILALLIITFIAQSFLVHGVSMEPTLHNGERLMVDKVTYRFRPPHRGEIIVFRYPANPRNKYIKRVMGLPGDQVEVRHHVVYINGQALDEPYINGPTYNDYGPVVVPKNTVFVLGDNRNLSADSRMPDVGPVPYKNIVGRAFVRFWPLTRIGLVRVPAQFVEEEL